jgi:hypothetical protein
MRCSFSIGFVDWFSSQTAVRHSEDHARPVVRSSDNAKFRKPLNVTAGNRGNSPKQCLGRHGSLEHPPQSAPFRCVCSSASEEFRASHGSVISVNGHENEPRFRETLVSGQLTLEARGQGPRQHGNDRRPEVHTACFNIARTGPKFESLPSYRVGSLRNQQPLGPAGKESASGMGSAMSTSSRSNRLSGSFNLCFAAPLDLLGRVRSEPRVCLHLGLSITKLGTKIRADSSINRRVLSRIR